MRGNAWLIEPSKFAERRLLIAWKCAELRLPIAWKCAELRPANAWKCAEPRHAWECELRGRLRTATRVRGTRVGSAREVRLKCGSSAWNRGSTHWWVPYLYGTDTSRVKKTHDFLSNLNQLRLFRFDLFGICGFVWLMTFNNRYFSQCLRFLAEVSWPEFGHYQTKSITYTICRSCGSVFSAIFIEVSI